METNILTITIILEYLYFLMLPEKIKNLDFKLDNYDF